MADETTVTEPVEPEPSPEPGEPEPEPTPEPPPAPEPDPQARCEAETTAGGVLYRCSLEPNHEDDHRFQPVEQPEQGAEAGNDAVDKAIPRLEAESARHAKRVIEIMGRDSEGLIVCELCLPMIPGYRWDSAPDEKTVQRVRTAIGMPDLSNFRPSSTEAVCDDCAGLGKVRTGSSVPKFETATCDACAGKGYRETRPRLNEQPSPTAPEQSSNGEAPVYDDGVRRDMFGTPETDPDFEKLPGVRIRPVDYWQTNRE